MPYKILATTLMFLIIMTPVYAQKQMQMQGTASQQMMMSNDKRISLNLPSHMKIHQLQNMRSHVEAVQTIIGLIAENDFIKASEVAHSKLGLTEEMKKMCNMFNNEGFRSIGLQFHRSADDLAKTLKTGDIKKSLNALHDTMSYCVQCHSTYRQ